MVDVKKEVKENPIILILIPKDKYKESFLSASKTVESLFSKLVFLSVSKPYMTLKKDLRESGVKVEKIHFIDTLTATVKDPPHADDCTFVSSPNDLTEISVAISEKMKYAEALVVDSLTTFLVYGDSKNVTKFVHSIVTKCQTISKNLIFIALQEDINTELIRELHVFANKVIVI